MVDCWLFCCCNYVKFSTVRWVKVSFSFHSFLYNELRKMWHFFQTIWMFIRLGHNLMLLVQLASAVFREPLTRVLKANSVPLSNRRGAVKSRLERNHQETVWTSSVRWLWSCDYFRSARLQIGPGFCSPPQRWASEPPPLYCFYWPLAWLKVRIRV